MAYLINGDTGEFILYSASLGSIYFNLPWRDATQEEIDAYLLAQAKSDKLGALTSAKESCCATGFTYSGNTFPTPSSAIGNILLKDNLLGYTSDNVSTMASTSAYILPAGHGIKANVGQIIEVAGFVTSGNNGTKTVYQLDGDFLVIDEALADEAVGESITIGAINRYIYYDIDGVPVDFATKAAWDDFFSAIMMEKDRIMVYCCSTEAQINACTTVAEVAAITINFEA